MNKIYRLIWSESRKSWVVGHERARTRGKAGGGLTRTVVTAVAGACGIAGMFYMSGAAASPPAPTTLPQGGVVTAGSANISQPNGNQLTITQATQQAVINWNSFDIGSQAKVDFVQPDAHSSVLNRVLSNDPTQIFGQLSANGQVYIVNPSGIVFGAGSRVDAGGLVASTNNISDADFMAGNNRFVRGAATGSVTNAGSLNAAPGGYVALIGAKVTNTGSINTPNGSAILAAGNTVRLPVSSSGLITMELDPATVNAAVANTTDGLITATNGQVYLSAAAASGLATQVVNQGHIVADQGGSVTLSAIQADRLGETRQEGLIDASNAQGRGGNIALLGDRVGLFAGSRTLATGKDGGGTVLVGGNYQGQGPEHNASAVYMDGTAAIDASATQNGRGGKVVLWSQDYTAFDGTIDAKGGLNGGDGGFVETSSHDNLQAFGRVDASSPLGQAGRWLLDPTDVTIVTGAANSNDTVSGGVWTPTTNSAQIGVTNINANLNAGTSVTINTASAGAGTGNITQNAGATINKTAGGNATLTMNAAGSITLNGGIGSTSGTLSTVLNAAGGGVGGSGTINTNGGLLTINASGSGTLSGVISGAGGLTKTGAGTTTLDAGSANTYTGATTVNGGTLQIGTGGTAQGIDAASAVNVASGATLIWNNANSGGVQTIANAISGAGTVRLQGQNATTALSTSNYNITGNNSGFSGTFQLNRSILWNTTQQSELGSATIEVQDRATVGFNGGTFSNNIIVQNGAGWHHNVSGSDVVLGAIRLEGNNTLTGNIQLNNTSGVVLGDGTGANSTIGSYSGGTDTLSGVISGPGEFSMSRYTSWNGGTPAATNIILSGSQSNTYTGKTVVDGQGNVATLTLAKSGGAVAIAAGTTVQMGNNTGSVPNLRMGADNQFGAGVVMNFVNADSMWSRFDLLGTNQTLAGINSGTASTASGGVVQNGGYGLASNTNGTLTLNGTGSYLYNGFIRDADSGGGTGLLNLVHAGTGTQILTSDTINNPSTNNSRLYYTGSTTVNGGTLQIGTGGTTGVIAAASAVNVGSGGTMVWNNANTTGNTVIANAISGAGTVRLQGQNDTTALSVSQYDFTGNNSGFSGTLQLNRSILWNTTQQSEVGSATIEVQDRGTVTFNGGTFSNNIIVQNGAGWHHNNFGNDFVLGAIRLEGSNTLSGNIQLNNMISVVPGDVTGANSTIGSYLGGINTLSGVISGPGDFSMSRLTSWHDGSPVAVNFVLAGNQSNTYTGKTVVDGQGGVATLTLAKTGGAVAIAGGTTVQMGDETSSAANLRMGQNDQFGAGVVMNFVNASPQFMRFDLLGTNQTLAGLNAGTASTLGGGVIQNGGFNLASNANGTLTLNGTGSYLYNGYFRNADSGGGTGLLNLVKAGSGNQVLAGGVIQHTGTTAVNAGTLDLRDATGYFSPTTVSSGGTLITSGTSNVTTGASALLTLNGGTYNHTSTGFEAWSGGLTVAADSTINVTNSGANNQVFFDGPTLSGAGDLTINNTGATSTGVSFRGSAASTYAGDLIVNGGKIATQGNVFAFDNANVTLNNANWYMDGSQYSTAVSNDHAKSLNGNGNVFTGAQTLTVGTHNGSGSFSGVISGTNGVLVKNGSGTQVLTGNNTYTGTTTVSGGTLQVGNGGTSGTLGTGAVTNNANLVFTRSDAYTIPNTITGTGTMTATSGDNLTIGGSVTQTGNITLTAGADDGVSSAPNGSVTGGDVTLNANVTSTGAGATVAIYSGNATTAAYTARVSGSATSLNKAYRTAPGTGSIDTGKKLNVFYRVSPAATISIGASNKVYDATTAASVNLAGAIVSGAIDGDDLGVSGASASFADKNAGTGKTVNVTGIGVASKTAGVTVSGYQVANATSTANITPAALTLTATSNTKTYDATTGAAAGPTVSGLQGADTVTGLSESYADKNAGTGKTLSVNAGYVVNDGNGGNNYTVSTVDNTTGVINKAALTLTAVANTKTYDATTGAAAGPAVSGLQGADSVSGLTESYADKNAGTGKTVSVDAGYVVNDGNGGNNYTVNTVNNTAGVINKAALTLTATSNTKTYDATTGAAAGPSISGLQGADTVTGLSESYADKNAGTAKTLSVDGGYVVNDGNGGNNYAVSTVNNTTGVINKAALTMTAVSDTKTYDTTASSAGAPTVGGLFGSDSVTGISQSFADKNTGTGKTLSVNAGYTLNDGNGGNNYAVSTVNNTTGVINKAALTLTAVSDTKTYDTTANSAGTPTVSGLLGSDSATGISQSFADKNAGTGKTLSVNAGYVVNDGNGGNNYTVSTVDNTTGVINKAALTLTAVSDTKTYDTTASSAGAPTVSGLFGSDSVTGISQSFADKNAGTGKTLSVNAGYTLNDGNGGNNYAVSTVNNTTGVINKAALTVIANNDAKFVTKADNAGYAGASYTGFVGGEDASVLGGTLNIVRSNAGVGEAAGIYNGVLNASGFTSGNYTIAYIAGNYTVVPANQLLVRLNNVSATYGSTPAYGVQTAQYMLPDGTVVDVNSTVTGSHVSVNDGAGGNVDFNIAVTGAAYSTGNNLRVNSYQLDGGNVTGNSANFSNTLTVLGARTVNPLAITVSPIGVSKTYDATTAMTGLTLNLNGALAGDIVTADGNGSFASKNAGTNLAYTVSNLGLSGADAANYTLANGGSSYNGNDGVINKAALTLTATSNTKTYDATTGAAAGPTVSGLQGADTVTGLSESYADKNAGTGKTLSVNAGYVVNDGNGGNNYTVSTVDNTTGVINKAALTLTATSNTKTYDATTSAAAGPTVSGLQGTDTVTGLSESYADKNAGTGKTLSVNAGYVVNDGNGGNNYTVNTVDNTTGVINKAALTLTATSNTKTYDATTGAAAGPSISGLQGADTVTGLSESYADKNAGTGKTLSVNAGYVVNDGNGGNNYTVSTVDNTTGVINKAALTLTAVANTKTYDATTGAAAGPAVSGLQGADSVSGLTESYADKNVGTGKTLSVNAGYVVNDGNGGNNYTVSTVDNTTGVINKAALTLTATSNTKTYDATTGAAAGPTVSGLQGADTVTGLSESYADKNAGTGKTLSVDGGYVVNDGNGGNNYAVSTVNNTTGVINKAALTLTAVANAKTYDATTGAAAGPAVSGLQGADSVSGLTESYADKNAGTGKTLSVNAGYVVNDGNGGNNYAVSTVNNTTGVINKAALTLTAVSDTKTYDTTANSAGAPTVIGLFGSDSVTGISQSFADKNAGTGKTLSVNAGYTLNDGNGGNNYAVSTVNNTTGVINKAALTLTAVSDTKTYDATANSASAPTVSGLLGSDSVAGISQSFADKNAGTGKTLSVNAGYTLNDGNSGNNYAVSTVNNTTGVINKAALTVIANNDAKFVGKADNAGYAGASYTGFVGGEDASVLGGTLNIVRSNAGVGEAAGTYHGVLNASGFTSGNYTIAYIAGNYTVVPANQLLVRLNNVSATYGSTPAYGVQTAQYMLPDGTVVNVNSTVTGSHVSVNDGAGGNVDFNIAVTGAAYSTGNNLRVNSYQLDGGNVTGNSANFSNTLTVLGARTVTPLAITVSPTGVSKTYDATASVTGLTLNLNGALAGDIVTADGNGSFASKNAGTNLAYTVSNLGLSGADAANYTLANGGSTYNGNDGVINKAALTLTATSNTKTYDATTGAAAGPAVSGLQGADSVSGLTESYADKNAGSGKTLSVNAGYVVNDGNGGNNYTVNTVDNTTGVINKAALTLTATSNTKTYDATTSAAAGPTVSGLQGADTVTGLSESYADKNAGTGKTLSVNAGYVVNDGNGGNNYTVNTVDNTTGVINKATLTLTAVGDTKTYDATTSSAGAPAVSGLLGTDTVAGTSQSFADKNAGTGKTLSVNAGYVVNDGNGGNNYTVNKVSNTTGVITPRSITVAAPDNVTKAFDGTISVPSSYVPVISGGVGEGVQSALLSYGTPDIGSGKTVNVSNVVMNDGNGGNNYAVTVVANTTGIVNPVAAPVIRNVQPMPEVASTVRRNVPSNASDIALEVPISLEGRLQADGYIQLTDILPQIPEITTLTSVAETGLNSLPAGVSYDAMRGQLQYEKLTDIPSNLTATGLDRNNRLRHIKLRLRFRQPKADSLAGTL